MKTGCIVTSAPSAPAGNPIAHANVPERPHLTQGVRETIAQRVHGIKFRRLTVPGQLDEHAIAVADRRRENVGPSNRMA